MTLRKVSKELAFAGGLEHKDPGVNVDNVAAHGYAPSALPKHYLTEGRWYYITGALMRSDGTTVVLGAPIQYVGDIDEGVMEFITTQEVLTSLGLDAVAPAEAPIYLTTEESTVCHIFKFLPRYRVVESSGLAQATAIVEISPQRILSDTLAAKARLKIAEALFKDAADAFESARLNVLAARQDLRDFQSKLIDATE